MTHQEWQTKFRELFSEIDDRWDLEIVSNLAPKNGWTETSYKIGIAKFECGNPTCDNKWKSKNGRALFRYQRSPGSNNGNVKLLLRGQKCEMCDDVFQDAKWDGLSIENVLKKLLKKVKQKFYGLDDGTITTGDNQYIPANTTASHQTHLFQLCHLGNYPCNRQGDIESIASQLEDLDDDYWPDYND